jgi:hypothetical protein
VVVPYSRREPGIFGGGVGQGLGGGASPTRRGGVKAMTRPARQRSLNGGDAPVVFGGDSGLL